jgi:hypothetical protein
LQSAHAKAKEQVPCDIAVAVSPGTLSSKELTDILAYVVSKQRSTTWVTLDDAANIADRRVENN